MAPASLLANWASEADALHAGAAPARRPSLRHAAAELQELSPRRLEGIDLVVTSYASLLRLPWLETTRFDLVVLDEAQAIKNPGARQTRAAKKLDGRARIALTGTPVENRLSDLWSIFDFANPGLLGSAQEFTAFTKRLAERPHNPFEPLRELVRPYILRRLKTDRSVIADLPDKTEVQAFCALSPKQAALYQEAVRELGAEDRGHRGDRAEGADPVVPHALQADLQPPVAVAGRRSDWAEADSGKFGRLREIAEVLAARQEKVLVFTQFREATAPLAAHLAVRLRTRRASCCTARPRSASARSS